MNNMDYDAEPHRGAPNQTRGQDFGGEKVDKNSLKYRLRNQLISGFSFLPNIKCSIIFSLVLGIILLALGTGVLLVSNSIIQVDQRYDDVCGINQPDCQVTVQISTKIEQPVFFYLEVQNFYQNHRLYVKSYDADQLFGENVGISKLKNCDPVTRNEDVSVPLTSPTGFTLPTDAVANPCGLIAKSYIDDGFSLATSPGGVSIPIRTTGIAWSVDKERKFKRNDQWTTTQYLDMEDERLMNWMSFSTLYYWKKLWGIIDQDLDVGTYKFTIYNSKGFDVLSFDGEKHILLSNVSKLGGTSVLLGTIFLIMGGVYVALAIVIILYTLIKKKSNDVNYSNIDFSWD